MIYGMCSEPSLFHDSLAVFFGVGWIYALGLGLGIYAWWRTR
jgi:hypothetical protein